MTTGTGADVLVTELPDHRLEEAARVLARGFRYSPNFVDLFPDEEVRYRVLPLLRRACLRDALGFGRVYAASRDGEPGGVAAWLPPGAFPLAPRRQLRMMPEMLRVLAAAPRSVLRRVHGPRFGVAPRAAVLVPGGRRGRARRAGVGDRHAAPGARARPGRRGGAALLSRDHDATQRRLVPEPGFRGREGRDLLHARGAAELDHAPSSGAAVRSEAANREEPRRPRAVTQPESKGAYG